MPSLEILTVTPLELVTSPETTWRPAVEAAEAVASFVAEAWAVNVVSADLALTSYTPSAGMAVAENALDKDAWLLISPTSAASISLISVSPSVAV